MLIHRCVYLYCIAIILTQVSCRNDISGPAQPTTAKIQLNLKNADKAGIHTGYFWDKSGSLNLPRQIKSTTANDTITAPIDEVKLLILDMTNYSNESTFINAWDAANQVSLIDTSLRSKLLREGVVDIFDIYDILYKSYTGSFYKYLGNYSFSVSGGKAGGEIYLNPGLNYFYFAFRSKGKSISDNDQSNVIVENQENTIKAEAPQSGSACPGIQTVTHFGKTYNTVLIGGQCWLKENLDVGLRVNGNVTQSNNGTIEKYCYNDSDTNCAKYGGLYQWAEAVQYQNGATHISSPNPAFTYNIQGICPTGWHIPTKEEYAVLLTTVIGYSGGNGLKAIGEGIENGAGSNATGFSALLSGWRDGNASFNDLGRNTYFWSSAESDTGKAVRLGLACDIGSVIVNTGSKTLGLQIRCIKDVDNTSAPIVPVLSSPISHTADVELSVTLSWNLTAAAESYSLQVSTDSLFRGFIYNQSGLTGTNQQIPGLSNATKYYWRLNAANTYGTSGWSNVWDFITLGTAPNAPVLGTPKNDTTDLNYPPTLAWKKSNTATSYSLQVAADTGFAALIYNKSGLQDTSQQIAGLNNLTKYYWRVNAANKYGVSGWSTVWNFTTVGVAPNAPVLAAPDNNIVDVNLTPALIWHSSAKAVSYTLQVSTDTLFVSIIYSKDGLIDTTQQISGLSNFTKYYWRVNATNKYGTSNWSSIWNFTVTGITPNVPVLSTPPANSIDVSVSPMLTWNASVTAASYALQVSTDSLFSSYVYNQSGLTTTSQQISGLNNFAKYYWRVNAANKYGTSGWSSIWSFTVIGIAPNTPLLATPANNAVDVSLSITLTWNASTTAQGYTLQVSVDSLFSTYVFNQSSLPGTTQQISGLNNLIKYFWRVAATNSYGTSGWSSVWKFTTIGTEPSTPALGSPANNTVDVSIPPTLTWAASAGSTSYRLQVATDTGFTSIIFNDSTLTSTSKQVASLTNSTKYYWRVQAKNSYGVSGWSSVWNFTTIGIAPSVPVLVTPTNNTIDVSISPTLTWNASATATSYTLQVSADSLFASTIYNQSGLTSTTQQLSGLNNVTKYYWRVRATNSYGTSGWSLVWNFSTIGTAPSVPVLATPVNNAVDIGVSPTLTWDVSAVATSYALQVSTDSLFSTFIFNQSGLTSTSQQISGLSNVTKYYWHINATSSYGTSGWSSVWHFTTTGVAPSIPVLASPANNLIDVELTPTLSWNASATATSYTLQVSTDAGFTNFVYNKSGLTTTSQQVSIQTNLAKFFWRVSATNNYGTSDWSSVWSFTTVGTAPAIPTMATPSDKAGDLSLSPILTWNVSTTAVSYTLQVSTDSLFSSFVYNKNDLTTTNQQLVGLNYLTKYYWRVSATNSYGTSGWSTSWSFTTIGSAPSIPVLATPINNTADIAIPPTLTWSASAGSKNYRLQVATDSLFTTIVFNDSTITAISTQITGLGYSSQYFWRVSAANSYGTSNWSGTWSFTTQGNPCPGTPTVTYAGKTYHTVQIGSQCWLKENLDVGSRINGSGTQTDNGTIEKYCYNDDPANCDTYGGLYEWNESMQYVTTAGTQGICPAGWHIPTQAEFQVLESTVKNDGNTLKAAGQGSGSGAGTNTSGFSALLGGSRHYLGYFNSIREYIPLWSTTEYDATNASYSYLNYDDSTIRSANSSKNYGLSVRCLKGDGTVSPPALSSPSTGAIDVSISPTLSWNASSTATSYTLQVSADSLFSTYMYNQNGLTGTSQQISGLNNFTKYYWRLSASNGLSTSGWSDVWNFVTIKTAPGATQIVLPACNAKDISITPTIIWMKSAMAVSYTLQVATDNGFANTIYNQSNIADTSMQVPELSGLTTYWMRVNATNTLGTSGWSGECSFTTEKTFPENTQTVLPVCGSGDVSITPIITWNKSARATSYNLQVATDNGFANTIFNQSNIADTSLLAPELNGLTTYYMRVSATNKYATSNWSGECSFTTEKTFPENTQTVLPVCGSKDISITPTIVWNKSARATSYTLQISTDVGFANTVYNQGGITDTSIQAPELNGLTTYYMRVSATNKYATSNWSGECAFTTIKTAPEIPQLVLPVCNELNVSITPTITWMKSARAATYDLQIATDNGFANMVYTQTGITDTNHLVPELNRLTTYYMRVRAINRFATSNWSGECGFTTIGTAPAAPNLSTPTNSTMDIGLSLTLTWSASTMATSYMLQVSADSSFASFIYSEGQITGTSRQVTGLGYSSTYYWRVNATNTYGTSGWSGTWSFSTQGNPCPGIPSVDYAGKVYKTVQIGSQCWLQENLDIGTRINGGSSQTDNGTIEKYCYNDDPANCAMYGGLYEWHEMMQYVTTAGTQGICPTGWHLPTIDEYHTLAAAVSDASALKAVGNGGGTNTSGFSGLLEGYRYYLDYTYINVGNAVYLWTSSEFGTDKASATYLVKENSIVTYGYDFKQDAFSVRCLKGDGVLSPPLAPILSSPSSGLIDVTLPPTLSWNASATATSYALQISTDAGFSNLIYNNSGFTETSQVITGLNYLTKYYWRVNATSSNGTSGWSNIWDFTTTKLGSAPSTPTLTAPADKGSVVSLFSTLNWSCSDPDGDPLTYTLYYGTSSPPQNVISGITASTYSLYSIAHSGITYYWYIIADDSHGNNSKSETHTFTISSAPIALPCPGTETVDYEGTTYHTVQMGTQCWLKENLNVGIRIDGSGYQTNNGILEKNCFNDDTTYCNVYGGLYEWNEAMQYAGGGSGIQGICPSGWHIPDTSEVRIFAEYVNYEGNYLKAVGQGTEVGIGNNASGFTALLGGYRHHLGYGITYDGMSLETDFWTSVPSGSNTYYMAIHGWLNDVVLNADINTLAFSVRCIKN